MINQAYKALLNGKSVIRQMSEYASMRGKEIGYENVFDFSLGNPSVPAPQKCADVMIEMLQTMEPVALHGYTPSKTDPATCAAIAESLNRRFGMDYTGNHIFMTTGAGGALAHALRAVTTPGQEVITFAPFFPEYMQYVGQTGAVLKVVPPNYLDFQIQFGEFEAMLNENTAAVLINTPNNPSGAVLSEETILRMADLLRRKQQEYGHQIFIISDEPYREIAFDGKTVPYVSRYFENVLSCYSFSKSLSLPGERIGYVAVNPKAEDAELLTTIFSQISRGIGHNCPSSLMQFTVARTCDLTSDLSVYEKNMNLLYDCLTGLGFSVVRPGGTFYLFPKCLEEDSIAFCEKAKKYDLIFVPGDSFGCPGYFRIAYCIDTEKVERSLPAFRKFVETEYPNR